MKRSHSSENWQDQDDSSHLLLNNFENELCTKTKNDRITSNNGEDQLIFMKKELVNTVIKQTTSNNDTNISKPHYKDGKILFYYDKKK